MGLRKRRFPRQGEDKGLFLRFIDGQCLAHLAGLQGANALRCDGFKAEGFQRQGCPASGQHHGVHRQAIPGGSALAIRDGFHPKACGEANALFQFCGLALYQRICLAIRRQGTQRQQGALEQREDGDGAIRMETLAGIGQKGSHVAGTGNSRPGEIDAFEKVLFGRSARQQFEGFLPGSPQCKHAKTLAAVLASALRRQFAEGFAKGRIIGAHLELETSRRGCRRIVAKTVMVPEDALGLPGLQSLLELFGETRGIGRGLKGFDGQHGRSGVMTVTATCIRRKPSEDDIGPEGSNGAHHIPQGRLVAPETQGFFRGFGKAEIHRPGEKLFRTINASGSAQFLGANGRQGIPQLRADQVLSTATPRHGEIGRAQIAAPTEGGQGGRVLVIRVGRDVEHAAHHLQFVQGFQEFRRILHGQRCLGG